MRSRAHLWTLIKSQLRVGTLGFGGPLATMSLMREELVERKKLVSSDRYLEGLGAVKLMPGPVSSLLAVYLGLEVAGFWGGLVSIVSFVLPSFLMLMLIAYLEAWAGPAILHSQGFLSAMHGVQAAVLAVILQSCWKLFRDAQVRSYAGQPRPRFAIAGALISAILLRAGYAEIWILVFCALLGFGWLRFTTIAGATRKSSSPLGVSAFAIFAAFFKAGLTVFGTGYMVLPYLQRVMVAQNGWLQADQFLDAVAYGNLTPGPVVIASTYMGFKISGASGALAATLGIFGGPTLLMLLIGPLLKRIMGRSWVEGALLGLLPAVAGSIAVGTLMLAQGLVWTWVTYAIFASAALLLYSGFKAPRVLIACAGLGLLAGYL